MENVNVQSNAMPGKHLKLPPERIQIHMDHLEFVVDVRTLLTETFTRVLMKSMTFSKGFESSREW